MNGVCKCIKIRHVMKLWPIARKLRNVASVLRAAQALAGKLLSPRSCRVSYVSEDKHVHVVGVKKSNDGFRRSLSLIPPDVPSGHLAVHVGQKCNRRFVIRVAYLNHPVFRELLEQDEEEFGYTQQGVLAIPCDELLFENILRLFIQNDLAAVMHLHLETVKSNFCKESTPLHVIGEKSIG